MNIGLTAPLYLSASWILTVSYQLLTVSAVGTIANSIAVLLPSTSVWLNANIETITFV